MKKANLFKKTGAMIAAVMMIVALSGCGNEGQQSGEISRNTVSSTGSKPANGTVASNDQNSDPMTGDGVPLFVGSTVFKYCLPVNTAMGRVVSINKDGTVMVNWETVSYVGKTYPIQSDDNNQYSAHYYYDEQHSKHSLSGLYRQCSTDKLFAKSENAANDYYGRELV